MQWRLSRENPWRNFTALSVFRQNRPRLFPPHEPFDDFAAALCIPRPAAPRRPVSGDSADAFACRSPVAIVAFSSSVVRAQVPTISALSPLAVASRRDGRTSPSLAAT